MITTPHGATTKKTAVFVLAYVRISNLTVLCENLTPHSFFNCYLCHNKWFLASCQFYLIILAILYITVLLLKLFIGLQSINVPLAHCLHYCDLGEESLRSRTYCLHGSCYSLNDRTLVWHAVCSNVVWCNSSLSDEQRTVWALCAYKNRMKFAVQNVFAIPLHKLCNELSQITRC
jgi:hypothetical protein